MGVGLAGIGIALLVGLAVGTVNGFFIGHLKISPFMVTLAMQAVARGATIGISNNARIPITNETYTWFGGESFKIGALDIPVSVILIVAVAVVALSLIHILISLLR